MKELILDEVFMHDEPDDKSRVVYFDGTTFEAIDDNGHVRRFVYSKPLSELTDEEFRRVLNYNRSEPPFNILFPDEVFVQGEFITEVF